MFSAVYRQMVTSVRYRITWLKIAVVCFIVVYTALRIYLKPGTLPLPVADRPPLASFVQRPAAVTTDSDGKIPKILHQTWRSHSELPETFRTWMSSWLQHNKRWEYWLWTDDDIRLFIATVFPQYLSLFDSYPAQSYRVDAFR